MRIQPTCDPSECSASKRGHRALAGTLASFLGGRNFEGPAFDEMQEQVESVGGPARDRLRARKASA